MMAPILSSLLYVCTFASASVAGNSIKQSYQNIADAAQTPFRGGPSASPLTITVRDEVTVSHPAEQAEADIFVQACDADPRVAISNFEQHLRTLQTMFDGRGLNNSVKGTTREHMQSDAWDDFELRPRRRRSKYHDSDSDSREAEEDEEPAKHCASNTLIVSVPDFDLLPNLAANLTAETAQAKVDYIDWQLTDTTKSAKRSELRRKALAALQESADDYAAAIGVDSAKMVEVDEQYGYDSTGRRRRGRYVFWKDEGEPDMTVPDFEITVEVRAKFTT